VLCIEWDVKHYSLTQFIVFTCNTSYSDSSKMNNITLHIFLTCHIVSLLLQRYAMDAAFYMAKELLMTERTYKKDLQVIAVVSKGHLKFMCFFVNYSTFTIDVIP